MRTRNMHEYVSRSCLSKDQVSLQWINEWETFIQLYCSWSEYELFNASAVKSINYIELDSSPCRFPLRSKSILCTTVPRISDVSIWPRPEWWAVLLKITRLNQLSSFTTRCELPRQECTRLRVNCKREVNARSASTDAHGSVIGFTDISQERRQRTTIRPRVTQI